MVSYLCPRCGYETNKKCNIKTHFNRKKGCKPIRSEIDIKEFRESILNGTYKEDSFAINRISDNEIVVIGDVDASEHFAEANILENKIKELEETINNLKSQTHTVINNNNSTNINVNITLPHSSSNYGFLSDKDYIQCINRMMLSVPTLIQKVHFDAKHPENHNICITNSKNKRVMVYNEEQWDLCNQENIINELINNNEIVLEEWLDHGDEKYPKAMEKFQKYLELKEEDGVVDKIKEEIKLMLYNNRKLVNIKT